MYIPWKSCFVSVSFGSTLLTNVYVPPVGVGDTMLAFWILTLGMGGGVMDWFPATQNLTSLQQLMVHWQS